MNISDFLHTSARHLQPRAVLQSPVTVLLGVSDRAADVLRGLNIHTVFDLATSRLFGNAAAVTAAGNGATSVFGRFGAAPSDVIATSGRAYPVEDLHAKPLELLDGIGAAQAAALTDALSIATIRDLALWPPFVAAAAILRQVLQPEALDEYDPDAPRDLVPRTGEYPTEKVFYTSVVIDQIEGEPSQTLDGPVDVTTLAANVGFQKPATGAIITMEQAWYAQGVTLGNLLHSVALAPGESTRIAMIDWSRRTASPTARRPASRSPMEAPSARSGARSRAATPTAYRRP